MTAPLHRVQATLVLRAWEHAWTRASQVPGCPSCSGLHTSAASRARPEVERGRAQQAEIQSRLEKIEPQRVKQPKRSPEELAEAARRAKDYSRRSMHALRQAQAEQKQRLKLRCGLASMCTARLPQTSQTVFTPSPCSAS